MNVHNFQTVEKQWVRKWANDTFKWHDDYDQDPKYRGDAGRDEVINETYNELADKWLIRQNPTLAAEDERAAAVLSDRKGRKRQKTQVLI